MFIKLFSYALCLYTFSAYIQASERNVLLDPPGKTKIGHYNTLVEEFKRRIDENSNNTRQQSALKAQRGFQVNGNPDQKTQPIENKK